MDIDIADLTLTVTESGEIRVNVGDKATGKGFGAAVPLFGADGFVGAPNADDDAGCAQAIQLTQGNLRLAFAPRDNRYSDKAGALQPGDRAIVSDCDARLKLSQSGNSIALFSTNMGLALDGAGGNINLSNGPTAVTVGSTGFTISWSGSGVSLAVNITGLGIALSYTVGPVTSSITLGAGTVAIVAPNGVTVNGIPLAVP